MRAKLINEIKRNIEGSGLGSIGIGRIVFTKMYDYLHRHIPSIITYSTDLDNIDHMPDNIKECICNYFNTTSQNIIGISDKELYHTHRSGIKSDFGIHLQSIEDKTQKNYACRPYEDGVKKYFVKTLYKSEWGVLRLRVTDYNIDDIREECYTFFRK